MLRGSVNSMVGVAGLNVPLRAIERLTGAVEHAALTLERLERATVHLERFDEDVVDRVNDALDALADMSDDTHAIRERLDSIEAEVRDVRAMVLQRLDRVPLMRPRQRDRHTGERTAPASSTRRAK